MSTPAGPAYPPEGLTYPQLLRTPSWAWWKPLVGVVALLVTVFVVAGVVLIPVGVAAVAVQASLEHRSFADGLDDLSLRDHLTPASLLYLNLVLASGVPLALALVRWLHRLRPAWLTSVLPGIRWRFLGACLGVSVVALAVQVLLGSLLPTGDSGGDSAEVSGSLNHLTGQTVAFALVVLLTTPLQAMGEEYVFRGYLMQAAGSLFRRWGPLATWSTLLLTALLFALFHGTQNFPLFFDRFAFGVIAGYLVVRVGGLEAGIALHVLNNVVAYGFALLFGDITSLLDVTEASWWNLPVTVVQSVVYVVLVLLVARRMGLRTTTLGARAETSRTDPRHGVRPIGGPPA